MQHHGGGVVLSLIDFAAGWVSGWQQGRESSVALDFVAGRDDVPKRSASIAAESPKKLGSLTLWESGEIEIEVVELLSQERSLAISKVVSGPHELSDALARLVVEMGR